jgi:hypothetical protein
MFLYCILTWIANLGTTWIANLGHTSKAQAKAITFILTGAPSGGGGGVKATVAEVDP